MESAPITLVASTFILFAVAFVAAPGTRLDRPPRRHRLFRRGPPIRRSLAPLSAPKTSVAQDGQFLTKVTEADPAVLTTYEQKQGNVALRALLTDGSAFCAFLQRGAGIDNALADMAIGARGEEAKTHLPLSVTTFNTIRSGRALDLCPDDQKLLPASDRSKIRELGNALAKRAR